MNDNKMLNEAYDGINEGLFNLRQDRSQARSVTPDEFAQIPDEELKSSLLDIMVAVTGSEHDPERISLYQDRIERLSPEKLRDASQIFLKIGNSMADHFTSKDPGFMGGETQDND